jgi:hypothetical protein
MLFVDSRRLILQAKRQRNSKAWLLTKHGDQASAEFPEALLTSMRRRGEIEET